MAPTQQPESQLGALQIHAQPFLIDPRSPLQFAQGAADLGDLASRVVDGLRLAFERHADSVVQAPSRNATQIFCAGGLS